MQQFVELICLVTHYEAPLSERAIIESVV